MPFIQIGKTKSPKYIASIVSCLCVSAFLAFTTISYADFRPKFEGTKIVDRLDASGANAIQQFVEYAKFMGVKEADISSAIWNGEFSPTTSDLEKVYGQLAMRTLQNMGATIRPGVKWFNQGNLKQLAKIFGMDPKNFKRDYIAINKKKRLSIHKGWIQKFGPIPDSFFSFMKEAGVSISSPESWKKEVSMPATIVVGNLGGYRQAEAEYKKTRDQVYLPLLAKRMSEAGLKPTLVAAKPKAVVAKKRAQGSANIDTSIFHFPRKPTSKDIQFALRSEVNRKLAQLDAMAAKCKVVGETKNPLHGMSCLLSGAGRYNSKTVKLDIHSVELDECVVSVDKVAYCRYRARATMRGPGAIKIWATLFNGTQKLKKWTYGSFTYGSKRWSLRKVYDSCVWGEGKVNCKWRGRK